MHQNLMSCYQLTASFVSLLLIQFIKCHIVLNKKQIYPHFTCIPYMTYFSVTYMLVTSISHVTRNTVNILLKLSFQCYCHILQNKFGCHITNIVSHHPHSVHAYRSDISVNTQPSTIYTSHVTVMYVPEKNTARTMNIYAISLRGIYEGCMWHRWSHLHEQGSHKYYRCSEQIWLSHHNYRSHCPHFK